MSDRLEEELKGLLKRVSSAKLPHLTSDDVRLLANGLLPTSIRSARSLAFLCLSKYCQAVLKDEKSDEEKTDLIFSNFKPFLESCFAEHDEAEPELFIPFTTLPAALFPLAPLPAVRLVTTPLDASSDPSPDALSVLLEAAELPSPLQPALAELLAQASGTKPGRELVRSRAIEWLRGAVEFGDKSELGTLCAVALSKLGREESLPGSDQRAGVDPEESDEEALCQKMMAFVMSRPSSNSALLPTLEGLSILSVRPRIQEVLARSPSFLASLLALAPSIAARGGSLPVTPRGSMDVDDKLFEPVETSVCYGVTTILVNLTSRKPPMSAEDQQIAKLRAVAISGKKGPVRTEEDPLESEEAVKQRVKCVLKTDCVSALRGLARAESRLVKEGLGRLCLNLVEDKGDRPAFVREGGAKVLSGVVRDLTVGSATSKDSSIPNDTIVTLPAAQALAKLVITMPPHLLFPPPHLTTSFNALTPLYTLLIHPSSTPLQAFESLMALTNLASIDPSIASRIVEATVAPPHTESVWQSSGRDDKVKVIGKVEELMLDDNNMIRRAATELVCNLASSPAGFNYVTGHMAGGSSARVKSRLNILLVLTDVDDLPTRLAAGGALAILTQSKTACGALLSEAYDGSTPKRTVWSRSLRMLDPEDAAHELDEDNEAIPAISSTPPNPELVHRAVITLLNLFTYASSLDENRRSTEFATARKAGIEDKLLEVLRSGAGEEVLQPTVECLKLLQKYPAGSLLQFTLIDRANTMAALTRALPAPIYTPAPEYQDLTPILPAAPVIQIPKYGARKGWKPKNASDFGGGGAYPECHVAQYPLDMGRKKTGAGTTLAMQVDSDGLVRYDAIAQSGRAPGSRVQSSFKDLVPLANRSDVTDKEREMERPDDASIAETAERTRLALERITHGKIKAAQPKHVPKNNNESTYIRYTPANQTDEGGKQRIIKMTEVQEDPLEPPRFKHKKIPRGPTEPPAPVMQSPPRAATAQDQKDWMIPPCISNWKNNKGYTIPLDKRLAADGRGLQDVHINDNFAKFSEALYVADRHAREEVRARSQMQQLLAQKEKAQKEENLRLLAQRAREERNGITPAVTGSSSAGAAIKAPVEVGVNLGGYGSESEEEASDEEDEAVQEREQVRAEKRKEREKEMRMSNMGTEMRAKMLAKEQNRDISEKIALGLAKPTASKETLLDSRLFNREALSTGFASEDSYNLYDKPLFHGSSAAAAIYKSAGNAAGNDEAFGGGTEEGIREELSKDRFALGNATRGFEGAEGAEVREGPVQFEKDVVVSLDGTSDPFGVEQFMDAAKKGGKRMADSTEELARKRMRDD